MPPVNLSPALQRLADDLAAQTRRTPASLATALSAPIGIDDVAPFIRFNPHNYVRSLITKGEGWELRLLCWQPKQSSSLHGHARAACAFRILRGSAMETILGSRDRVWAPGDIVQERESALVHQLGNAGSDALLTLHA